MLLNNVVPGLVKKVSSNGNIEDSYKMANKRLNEQNPDEYEIGHRAMSSC